MVKKFNGANWVDTSVNRRWDGSAWVDCSNMKRWDGVNWVECMLSFQSFKENFSHVRIYHHSFTGLGDYRFDNSSSLRYYALSTSSNTDDPGHSTCGATLRFKAVMKNGKEYELDRKLLTLLNCDIYLAPRWSISGNTSAFHSGAVIRYFDKEYQTNLTGNEVANKAHGTYLPSYVSEIEIECYASSSWGASGAAVTLSVNNDSTDFHLLNLETREKFDLGYKFIFYPDMT